MMKREKNVCPLLTDPDNYVPDTIDLLENAETREYWLTCIDEMIKGIEKKAKLLIPNNANGAEVLTKCHEQFHEYIEKIRCEPLIVKPLSVRTLIDIYDTILDNNGFEDLWFHQKEKESIAAFGQFEERVREVDELLDFTEKWVELCKGFVAGNMFDWGARSVSEILEKSNGFGLPQAMEKIQQRPWFIDNVDSWIRKIRENPHQSAIIFVDNSGVDFVLGVLPLVRQFLIQGTIVYLAANSTPSLNDVTYTDLQFYLKLACEKCTVIQQSLRDNKLVAIDSGQKGTCLDLTKLNTDLCKIMESADLLILEGMGRAIHTNFNTKFEVDCLKVAVLKNEWLAKRLGANQFSVVFKYEAIPAITLST